MSDLQWKRSVLADPETSGVGCGADVGFPAEREGSRNLLKNRVISKDCQKIYERRGKTMDDLKPCPFCGREVTLVQFAPVFRHDIWVIVHKEKEPICFLWHSNGYEGKNKEDVKKLWNQRTD